jgi:hypothetical protein
MKLRTWATFVASAVVGGALVLPLNAGAFQRRVDVTACYPNSGSNFAAGPGDWNIWNNGTDDAHLMCPVPDDDSLLPQNINFLNVHVRGGNSGTIVVKPCLHFWDQPMCTCGTAATSTICCSQQQLSLGHPSLFSSANFNHFKYVAVTLPPHAGMAGMFISN